MKKRVTFNENNNIYHEVPSYDESRFGHVKRQKKKKKKSKSTDLQKVYLKDCTTGEKIPIPINGIFL